MLIKRKRKFIKVVKARLPWIANLIDEITAPELNLDPNEIKLKMRSTSPCLVCKGARALCGKERCPLLLRLESYVKIASVIRGRELEGSSPPSVFVGRIGYPYVYAGPLVPPVLGDTSIYDKPESWLSKSIDELVQLRFSLVRGKFPVNAQRPRPTPLLERTQELAMAKLSVDSELLFKSRPSKSILLDANVQPMGPSALLRDFRVEDAKIDSTIYRYYDAPDVKAKDAVLELYLRGVSVTQLQHAFSVGCFGIKVERKLVPTRWSITAVDSILSQHLRDEVIKRFPSISDYLVFESMHAGRKFLVLMFPSPWSYELIEAWYPKTTWNLDSSEIAICSDSEGYWGRKTYASIGGCYYAARLACCEYLARIKRQASCVVISEAYPGYVLPLGVWHVRELVRDALLRGPTKFADLREALIYASQRLKTPLDALLGQSKVLKDFLVQHRLTEFLKKGYLTESAKRSSHEVAGNL